MKSDNLPALFITDENASAQVIHALTPAGFAAWQHSGGAHGAWAAHNRFTARAGEILLLPDTAGGSDGVLLGLGEAGAPFALAPCVKRLPAGTYRLAEDAPAAMRAEAVLAWGLGAYHFDTYHSAPAPAQDYPQLVVPQQQLDQTLPIIRAIYHTRDLINTPACDMLPGDLQTALAALAKRYGGKMRAVVGNDLLAENMGLIHAVGRAAGSDAKHAPRFLDMQWRLNKAPKDAPLIVLIGKGVCFDTGGLNLKPGNSMAAMKKDMGGAAIAMGIAEAVMARGLPVRLRLLIGAVENAIGADAFRPGDVLQSHKGLSVEIGNTDAEGRLLLADLLSVADKGQEDAAVIMDFATLTGAARVALGPNLVPFYTHDDALAAALTKSAGATHDPLWRMPLWHDYDDWLKSNIADVNHISAGGQAGSITAALFLARFVRHPHWVHFDAYAWQNKASLGQPQGAAAQCLRAVCHYLEQTYGN